MTFGNIPFFGMSGSEIYHNFRGGTGDNGAGLYESAFRVQLLVKRYNERTTSITRLTTQMEGAWEGDAGGAARRGAGPLAVEHGLAKDSMMTAQNTLDNQFDAFQSAKKMVTEVPPTPDKPSAWDNITSLGGAGRDYESQMTQVNAANDHNVQVMSEYESASESNASRMPTTYGRITDDYAAVGIEKPPPPTPPVPYEPPPGTGTNPGTGNPNGTGNHHVPGTNEQTNPNNNNPNNNNNSNNNSNNPNNNTTNPNQNNITNPSEVRPPTTVEPPRLPPGQHPGQNPHHPGMPGMAPPPAFGPNGGGGGFGPGGGRGFGPGGGGGMGGGPGAGGGSGAGSGGSGAGARGLGSGFGPGGAAAAEGAQARGGIGGPGGAAGGRGGMGGGMGGMGAGGRRGEGEDDTEHERPSFLVEPDPHDTFGTDEITAPPVIGG